MNASLAPEVAAMSKPPIFIPKVEDESKLSEASRVWKWAAEHPGCKSSDIAEALNINSTQAARALWAAMENYKDRPFLERKAVGADGGKPVFEYYPVAGATVPLRAKKGEELKFAEGEVVAEKATAATQPAAPAKPRIVAHDPTHDIPDDELSDSSRVVKWMFANPSETGRRTGDISKATGVPTATVAAVLGTLFRNLKGNKAVLKREPGPIVVGKQSWIWAVVPGAIMPSLSRKHRRAQPAEPVAPAASIPAVHEAPGAPDEFGLPTEHIETPQAAQPVAVQTAQPMAAVIDSISTVFAQFLVGIAEQTIHKFEAAMQLQMPAPQAAPSFDVVERPAPKQKLRRAFVYGLRKDVSDRVEAQLSEFFEIKSCKDETADRLRQAVEWVGQDGVVCMMVDYISHSEVNVIKNHAKVRGRKVLHVGGTESGLVRVLEDNYLATAKH